MLNDEIRNTLLKIARRSLETAFSHEVYTVPEINMMRGAFVTLRKNGELRGCIGFLEGIMPLSDQVFTLARDAAFKDYRFPPLSESFPYPDVVRFSFRRLLMRQDGAGRKCCQP